MVEAALLAVGVLLILLGLALLLFAAYLVVSYSGSARWFEHHVLVLVLAIGCLGLGSVLVTP